MMSLVDHAAGRVVSSLLNQERAASHSCIQEALERLARARQRAELLNASDQYGTATAVALGCVLALKR